MSTILTSLFNSLPACSVCWGSDAKALAAANAGIGFMLAVLVVVLGSFLAFIIYLARRSRRFAGEGVEHHHPIESDTARNRRTNH